MLKKQTLFLGTLILLCANVLIKSLGFFYRVVLVRLLGTEGVGLTEMIVPVYSFFLVIAGWGISLAMSRAIAHADEARDYPAIGKVFSTGRTLLLINSLFITVIAFVLAPHFITYVAPDSRVYHCFLLLLPSIVIIALSSSYRSFFQGIQQISVIGGGQLTEQLLRTCAGIGFAFLLHPHGLEITILAVAIGTFFGELGGYIYLWLRFRTITTQHYPPIKSTTGRINLPLCWELLRFGTPVTLNRIVSSGILMAQSLLIPFALQKSGIDTPTATAIYGNFAGVAMALLHLPGVFTASLTVSLIPGIASALHQPHTLCNRIHQSLNATLYCTLPGMMLLFAFSSELCEILFHAPDAAPILRLLSLGGIFIYLQITLSAILQGLGEVQYLLFTMIINGVLLLSGIYWLTPQPWLGIRGAALALIVSAFASCILNTWRLMEKTRFRPQIKKGLLPPLLFTIISYVLLNTTKMLLLQKDCSIPVTMTGSAAVAMTAYGILLLLSGTFPLPHKK